MLLWTRIRFCSNPPFNPNPRGEGEGNLSLIDCRFSAWRETEIAKRKERRSWVDGGGEAAFNFNCVSLGESLEKFQPVLQAQPLVAYATTSFLRSPSHSCFPPRLRNAPLRCVTIVETIFSTRPIFSYRLEPSSPPPFSFYGKILEIYSPSDPYYSTNLL